MKTDCLMGTYGRHSLACEALACFLQQSVLSQATLLIYNQHPIPLRSDHPRVLDLQTGSGAYPPGGPSAEAVPGGHWITAVIPFG